VGGHLRIKKRGSQAWVRRSGTVGRGFLPPATEVLSVRSVGMRGSTSADGDRFVSKRYICRGGGRCELGEGGGREGRTSIAAVSAAQGEYNTSLILKCVGWERRDVRER